MVSYRRIIRRCPELVSRRNVDTFALRRAERGSALAFAVAFISSPYWQLSLAVARGVRFCGCLFLSARPCRWCCHVWPGAFGTSRNDAAPLPSRNHRYQIIRAIACAKVCETLDAFSHRRGPSRVFHPLCIGDGLGRTFDNSLSSFG